MLSGYKTYITATIGIITAVGAYLVGDIPLADCLQTVLGAVLSMTLRNGISARRAIPVEEPKA